MNIKFYFIENYDLWFSGVILINEKSLSERLLECKAMEAIYTL